MLLKVRVLPLAPRTVGTTVEERGTRVRMASRRQQFCLFVKSRRLLRGNLVILLLVLRVGRDVDRDWWDQSWKEVLGKT